MCDTMATVLEGRVLFAKNSDRDPNECQLLEFYPAREHTIGSTCRCTWIEIPETTRTNAVLLSRPFWMWGAEIGANEHQVVIGNEAVFTKAPYAKSGLTGMDLLRLALERSSTADQAWRTIVALLEEFGQGGGCGHEDRSFTYHNSFIVADPTSAFVLETAGKDWALEPVVGGRSISNGLTIPEFAKKHSDWLKTQVSGCQARQEKTSNKLSDVKEPIDLFAILRHHGSGEFPTYEWIRGGLSAPCVHAGGVLASSQTTASWVADLSANASMHWVTATPSPCTSLFKPIRFGEEVPDSFAAGDQFDASSLWWRHAYFDRIVQRSPKEAFTIFARGRDRLEREWTRSAPETKNAWQQASELLREWTDAAEKLDLTDERPLWARRYWAKRDKRAGIRRLESTKAKGLTHNQALMQK